MVQAKLGQAGGVAGRVVEPLSLARAKTQWMTGDWQSLSSIDMQQIADHPERDRLALLAACAHQQQGNDEQARTCTHSALAWGCDPQLVARLLISGVHNTLGRIGALKGDEAMLKAQFALALSATGEYDNNSAAHDRAVREMASMGLLQQAAALLEGQLGAIDRRALRPAALPSHVEMLRTEVELLQSELRLAHQRNQLQIGQDGGARRSAESAEAKAKRLSPSQLGQDLWVLERTGYKRGGFFVEFGATDGVLLSNTYLLENEFGWRGICVEPNPKMYSELRNNRRCIVSSACIGGRSGEEVEFVLAEEYGGMVKDMRGDLHAAKREAYFADQAYRTSFVTVSLHDLLTQLEAPRDIDYLSIDTEGSEYEILSTFPFHHWNIRLLTVEHNFGSTRGELRRLLESQGYKCKEARWDDWYERAA